MLDWLFLHFMVDMKLFSVFCALLDYNKVAYGAAIFLQYEVGPAPYLCDDNQSWTAYMKNINQKF